MSLSGCQINQIDVNFHLQFFLKFFDKNSADKIWSKIDKEIKVSPLMPSKRRHFKYVPSSFRYSVYLLKLEEKFAQV